MLLKKEKVPAEKEKEEAKKEQFCGKDHEKYLEWLKKIIIN